ncbi:MAG: hypothetical protein ACJATT_001787, partial [Myxococcota bacterium]
WALAETVHSQKRPFGLGFVRPISMRRVLTVSRWAVPFPLERFFQYHYTKVADQTLFLADAHLKSAAEHGVEMPAATELLHRIRVRRASLPSA